MYNIDLRGGSGGVDTEQEEISVKIRSSISNHLYRSV